MGLLHLGALMRSVFNHDYFECVCGTPEHVLRITGVPTPIFDDDGEVYVETYLNGYYPWYLRLLVAIKYVFKIKSKEGAFDCTVLSAEQVSKLAALLVSYEKSKVPARNADEVT